jgi:hypothetical protein
MLYMHGKGDSRVQLFPGTVKWLSGAGQDIHDFMEAAPEIQECLTIV